MTRDRLYIFLGLRKYNYVTISKKLPVGLPKPAKASTPEKVARMDALNKEIIENTK